MEFSKILETLKTESAFRLKQVKRVVFCDLIEDWEEATVLPAALREKLNKECPLEIGGEIFFAKDGKTLKALLTLKDGLKIETVLMRHQGRNTVCVSSQIGCALKCKFCATGKIGFKRNLLTDEIINQVLFFARRLEKEGACVNNVVFMGMGEPLLNYDNVLGAIRVLNDKGGFNLGIRHFSISTAGIPAGIKKLAKENLAVNLAISLHAPENKLRSGLMPINKKYPIEKVLAATDDYIVKMRRRVMIEYVLLAGVNDSLDDAQRLIKLAKRPLCFINLILYNNTEDFKRSPPAQVKKFKDFLYKAGIRATQRYRFGEDIEAACGQLAGGGTSIYDAN